MTLTLSFTSGATVLLHPLASSSGAQPVSLPVSKLRAGRLVPHYIQSETTEAAHHRVRGASAAQQQAPSSSAAHRTASAMQGGSAISTGP